MQDALKLNETSCGTGKSRVKKSVSYNNKNRPIIILLLYSKLVCRSYIDSLREWPALGSWIIAMHALPTHFFPCFSLFVLSLFCSLFVFSFFFIIILTRGYLCFRSPYLLCFTTIRVCLLYLICLLYFASLVLPLSNVRLLGFLRYRHPTRGRG